MARIILFGIGVVLYFVGILMIKTSAWYALLLLVLPFLGIYFRYKDFRNGLSN